MNILYFPCVWLYCCVHWALSLQRHRKSMDFGPEDVCGDLLFCPPFTSARVQSRFEFVELGGDMCCNCQGEVPAGTGITGWYQLVPGTIYLPVYRVCRCTRYVCMNIRMCMYYLWRTYGVPGTGENKCVYMHIFGGDCVPAILLLLLLYASKFPVSATKPSRGPCHTSICHLPALVGNGIKLCGRWWRFWMIYCTYLLLKYCIEYCYSSEASF